MQAILAINGALALLPVLAFLAVLASSDTFKLIRIRLIVLLIAAGAVSAVVAHTAGEFLIGRFDMDYAAFTRLPGPALEEMLKALIVVFLIRTHRVGFAFDAAIAGFAIGAGFALLENWYYLQAIGDKHPAIWVVRGFGTAIMHGGATAIFAVIALRLTPMMEKGGPLRFIPGLAAATALHATFNQFLAYPVASTIAMMIGLAGALAFILSRDRKSIEQVLAVDFEEHCKLYHEMVWGDFGEPEVAAMLKSLDVHFRPAELASTTRYIRLHTQLIIYTEALLKARERGGIVEVDETLIEKLEEFRAVEASIGRVARLALSRHLRFSRHESFKMHMLSRETEIAEARAG